MQAVLRAHVVRHVEALHRDTDRREDGGQLVDGRLVGAVRTTDGERRRIEPEHVTAVGRGRCREPSDDRHAPLLKLGCEQGRLTHAHLLGAAKLDDTSGHHECRVVREDRVGHVVLGRQHLDTAAQSLEQRDEVGVLTGQQVEVEGLSPVSNLVVPAG